jgi:hypothetical protein
MWRFAGVRIVAVLLLGFVMGAFPAAASDTECDGFLPDFLCDSEREARPAGHVNPMSMPYLFEDPYIATDINLVGIYHNYPSDSLMDGGEAGVVALQARLAITDRLAFIATKDGYMINRPDNGALNNREGFMDITAGFKYAVIDDREAGLIVTPSIRYEVPLGNDQVFQGFGDGVLIPAVSMGYGPENIHLIAGLGMQIAMDDDKNSTSFFYNLHLDQAFEVDCIPGADFIVPFIELNGTSYVASGDGSNKISTDSFGNQPLKVVQDVVFGAGIGLTLNFFLDPMIVFLHVHENGSHTGQSGGDKCRREEKTTGCTQTCGQDQTDLNLSGRLDLIGKTEFIHAAASDFDG